PFDAFLDGEAITELLSEQVFITRAVPITMRDGGVLVADIYYPQLAGQTPCSALPVILERTPYDRTIQRFRSFAIAAAQAGYVFVIQEVRGRGASEGHFHMMTNHPDEGVDGIDTWNWILAQKWCDGRLGTVGGSFSSA